MMGTSKVSDTEDSIEVRDLPSSAQTSLFKRAAFKESWRRIVLLILAVTVHNIPEGLAVGVGSVCLYYDASNHNFVSVLLQSVVQMHLPSNLLRILLLVLDCKTFPRVLLSHFHWLHLVILN